MSQENPDEPLIIKSDRAHTVSLSEGSTNAVGKKGEVGEPSIRKVVADPDEHPVEIIVMGEGVSHSPEKTADVVAKDDNFKGYQSVADAPDRFVDAPKEAPVPPPLRNSVEITKLETHLDQAQDIPAEVDALESDGLKEELLARARAAKQAAMPEMNFPARVINLKIQNDKLRTRMDNLESQE
jgi:hypothetical protein